MNKSQFSFVSTFFSSNFHLKTFINPVLKVTNFNIKTFPEGCASVCGYVADVNRYEAVQLSGVNENGDAIDMHLKGWNARIGWSLSLSLFKFIDIIWHIINYKYGL